MLVMRVFNTSDEEVWFNFIWKVEKIDKFATLDASLDTYNIL